MGTGVIAAATALLLAGCIPGGPPTPEQVNDQFNESIKPAWEVDVDGIFGEPVVREGLVFAYAIDDTDGMRLEVRSLEDGKLVWDHVASPGGAYANPLLEAGDSASRAYPFPSIRPIVMERAADDGEDGPQQLVVVFFERDIPENDSIRPDDILHVVDARTGDPLEVTYEPFDEFEFRPYGMLDDGNVFLNALDPGRNCGDGRICFLGSDAETSEATAMVTLDVEKLVLEYTPAVFPVPAEGVTVIPDFGAGYASLLTDTTNELAKYEDGQVVWQVDFETIFNSGVTPPAYIDFVEVGGLVLVQGYNALRETLDPALPHTLDLDFVASRTLAALDPDTGEVAWRAPGADMLCSSVHERTIAKDANTIPVCLATAGSFRYDLDSESMLEQEDLVASIAELKVADGSIGWEVPEVGETALANVGRLIEAVWASRGDLTVVAPVDSTTEEGEQSTGDVQLVDLTTGDALPIDNDAQLVCKMEREDVLPEFEGSIFSGGGNPIATGYPAGWYHFPCGTDGIEGGGWSKGAVRIAGYAEIGGDDEGGDNGEVVVLPTEGGLVAFEVG
jgi:hypothetical protein